MKKMKVVKLIQIKLYSLCYLQIEFGKNMEKKMEKEKIEILQEECLSIYNKMQEAIKLARDGKWYYSDTKMQGIKQKISNLYYEIGKLKQNNSEDNKN